MEGQRKAVERSRNGSENTTKGTPSFQRGGSTECSSRPSMWVWYRWTDSDPPTCCPAMSLMTSRLLVPLSRSAPGPGGQHVAIGIATEAVCPPGSGTYPTDPSAARPPLADRQTAVKGAILENF